MWGIVAQKGEREGGKKERKGEKERKRVELVISIRWIEGLDWLDPRMRQREGVVVKCCEVSSIIWASQDEQSSELESLPSYVCTQ
jgi:hypothetical protein